MKLRISSVFIILFFFACQQERKKTIQEEIAINYLIEIADFQKIAENDHIKIIDFRKPQFYVQGHIPGAVNIWRSDIENPNFQYGGMMPSKEMIEQLFSNLGIRNNDILIIYDDNGLCDASRLWWILQNYDFNNVLMLHGGFSEWKKSGGITTDTKSESIKSNFKLTKNPSMKFLASKEDVLKSIENNLILDARTADEYSGKRQKKGSLKGGRIPKSLWMDWTSAIDYHGDKKLKSKKDLDSIYGSLIGSKKDTIIVYCHSGVRSAHTTFVLTQLLGYEHVKNYDGSWTEWSHFNDYPFEKDSITTIKK